MPSHQKRREPLPKSYRFGDAAKQRIAGAIAPWIRAQYRELAYLATRKRREAELR